MNNPLEKMYLPVDEKKRASYRFVYDLFINNKLKKVTADDIGKDINILEILSLGKRPRISFFGAEMHTVRVLSVIKTRVEFVNKVTGVITVYFQKSNRFFKI